MSEPLELFRHFVQKRRPIKTFKNIWRMDDMRLRPHQKELQELGELAGVYMSPKVFKLIMELLNMGHSADTVYGLLKNILKTVPTSDEDNLEENH